ncbi:dual oxidase-like [Ostrea edulis]|uniref:dual oxidase-like n=1 Tax=Ostrea edulis TaxID=37623 RepID=UPI0024AF602F|nr:dual oxidase-like [Ostrea edulis]XP_048727889.2 dual oxidase-like [Ostrea edulis]
MHLNIHIIYLSHVLCSVASHKVQRFDGWYNNLAYPAWGSAGESLIHNISTAYTDLTYLPRLDDLPSAREVSSLLFRQDVANTTGHSKRNALFAFFGQVVAYEIVDSDEVSCPAELLTITVPKCDAAFDRTCTGHSVMPYERIKYDTATGQSPNNPRRQINSASSYIDASFVYGTSGVRASFLRQPGTGKLASLDLWEKFPELNSVRLPYLTFPNTDDKIANPEKLWRFGDDHIYENPALLSFGVLFFRYHNRLVQNMTNQPTETSAVDTFYKARQWLIASLQNIIMYEWLPKLLNADTPPYEGYKGNLEPGITAVFDAAAIRYILTLIPMGIRLLDDRCSTKNKIRLCTSYFDSQHILSYHEHAFEDVMRGMLFQEAEKEDIQIVPDIIDKFFGPLHYSRQDHVAYTIMKGRDYGLPDYNTVREKIGLLPVRTFEEINPKLAAENPMLFNKTRQLYGDVKDLDVFVGGMLETNDGPGELFKTIIQNQFYNIRHGDWFWFENTKSNIFTEEEIEKIKNIKLSDVLLSTNTLEEEHVPKDAFSFQNLSGCSPMYLGEEILEACPDHHGYDYFKGSELSFIILWTCFGIIPFVCILSAFAAAKCRKWKHANEVRKVQTKTITADYRSSFTGGEVSQYIAYEWLDEKEDERAIVLKIKPRCEIEVNSCTGRRLRSIKLLNQESVNIMTSSNKGRTYTSIKVPKEYDLVLKFTDSDSRQLFESDVIRSLESNQIQCNVIEERAQDILKNAFTQKKRNQRLEKFFKSVFSEAFQMDYDLNLEDDQLEKQQTKEILETELTKEEFAQALAVKPNSEFLENMFTMLDTNRNGYISFRDFLHMVVIFSKGSCQEKLQTIFGMFDIEGRGVLQKADLSRMFSSLLDMANSKLDKAAINTLIESICEEHGLEEQTEINFEDFCQILSPQMDKLYNAGLDWKGRRKCLPNNNEKKRGSENGRRRSSASHEMIKKKSSLNSLPQTTEEDGMRTPTDSRRSSDVRTRFIAIREQYHPAKAKLKTFTHFIENNRQHIFFLVIFFGATFALFAERFYHYTVEREHSGLRMIMSYGISFTRGAAAAMSFNFSILLLTMCRNLITWLRGTFLNLYVPFDSHVAFHKVAAWTALFFTCLHVIGYGFNFYHLATQPTSHLCIFDSIVLRSEFQPTFNFWFFGNMTGFTGVLLVICICIIYVYATQTARRLIFNGFWLTHKLITVMYILTILHGASTIVQKPMFFAYFIGPAILFTVDKMISMSRKKTELNVISAEKLPSDITHIEFKRPSNFDYQSGQWVRIACLTHGANEYHPFTLTSAPHEDTLSLHIRALGPWTWNIRQEFDPENHRDGSYPPIYLDGPYGAGQQDWYQYDVSVLVGAGIGVTPYASILKDFVHMASIKSMYKMKCQKLYFIWVTGSQRHFEWLLDIIREVEEVDEKGLVSVDIFITQFFQQFDMRTAMLYICEEHFQKLSGGRSVFTGLKANTHFGRPQLNSMFSAVHRAHPMVKKIGVFSCGPPGITNSVERGCVEASNTTRALFEHHFENF